MRGTTEVRDSAEVAKNSRPMGWMARTGLAARGLVYLLMGGLAILVAVGGKAHVDQRGALTEVIAQPFGSLIVAFMAIGFAAYSLWRLTEAAFGVTGEPEGPGPRLISLGRGIVYAVLTFTAVSVLLGVRGTQSGQQGHIAATVMHQPGGRWAVGIAGFVILGIGLVMIGEGWSKRFLRYFGYLPPRTRDAVVLLGRVGTVSRGVVFAVTGGLVVLAAVTADPQKAGGVDAAFKTILDQPYGAFLVALLGLGLVVFGIYGCAEAIWRRVTEADPR